MPERKIDVKGYRIRCNAVTYTGEQCNSLARPYGFYCGRHKKLEGVVKVKRQCVLCGEDFEPEQVYHNICRNCYYNGNPPKKCAAIKDNGQPCRRWVNHGESFCGAHLDAGYGLFTLAVKEAEQQAAKG